MTYDELIKENNSLKQELVGLSSLKETVKQQQQIISQLVRLIQGKKQEKFISDSPEGQLGLFDDLEKLLEVKPSQIEEVEIKSHKRKTSPGRKPLPNHLQRREVIFKPEAYDEATHTEIGRDITEVLQYQPASLFVLSIVRPRYVIKDNEDAGVIQASAPKRIVAKGMVGNNLIVGLIDEKIQFHTPVNRFNKKLKQSGINFIKNDQLYDWFHKGAEALLPLYHLLKKELLQQKYLQIDETGLKVLEADNRGSPHKGYMWLMLQPKLKTVLFEYHGGRSKAALLKLIRNYSGTVQCDGYEVYASLAKKQSYNIIYCMAHARRKFFDAQKTDPDRAKYFLQQVGLLYELERKLREELGSWQERYEMRQKHAKPILEELGNWLQKEYESSTLLPKSAIGKAVKYSLTRWKGLSAYINDGNYEIDNNLIENQVRPLALGRKNYLFAKNELTARNLACLYTLVGTAKLHGLNVFKYLNFLLDKSCTEKITDEAVKWLPHRMDKQELEQFMN